MREMGERMNGGAVRLERSPETLAILFTKPQAQRSITGGSCGRYIRADVRLEERCPAALLGGRHGLFVGDHNASNNDEANENRR